MALARTPLLSPLGIFLVALSLSIGWGIRGNYGHEIGAMFPGAIAAIAVCLLSGRGDWQKRVAYFAFFGALGWGFGGSISYMQVISYTHSGHAATQLYGFAGLYVIGFLWGALGGGGTALPAVLDRQRLTDLFVPVVFVLVIMGVAEEAIPRLAHALTSEGAMKRQDSLLYWLDSDYLQAAVALTVVLVFDLLERRFARAWELVLWGLAGAAAGAGLQWVLSATGLSDPLWNLLVRPQGDTSQFAAEKLPTNWPNFLPEVSQHIGWFVGLVIGTTIYFVRRGRFALGSRLLLYMALGWFAGFLLFPVLLGVRMTPPRGDNWAGIAGVVAGALAWCWREKLGAVAAAMLVSGAVGGLGFSGIALLKLLMVSFGNPVIEHDPAVVTVWQHWQQANWHSFLEQSYGFVNGIGIAVALGLLATRVGPCDDTAARRRWTEIVCVIFVVPWLIYVNMVKNVADWTAEHGADHYRSLPQKLQAPLLDSITLSAEQWFNIFFAVAAGGFIALLLAHARRRLAVVPSTWLGRGQLLYLVILWTFVLGNFTKALTGFTDQRLLTEGVILVHAVIATLLILLLPGEDQREQSVASTDLHRLVGGSVLFAVLCLLMCPPLEWAAVRTIYGDTHAGHAGKNIRFGDDADWKARPVVKGNPHR